MGRGGGGGLGMGVQGVAGKTRGLPIRTVRQCWLWWLGHNRWLGLSVVCVVGDAEHTCM